MPDHYPIALVADTFQIPATLETPEFRLRMLTVNDVVKDYAAVMSSVEHLLGKLDPHSDWPRGLSFEQDLVDLGWHQYEFQARASFAYTVMSLDESSCLGCVYIVPTRKRDYDAMVVMWVRLSVFEQGLDGFLYATIREWIDGNWPFSNPAYPGREMSWDEWGRLP